MDCLDNDELRESKPSFIFANASSVSLCGFALIGLGVASPFTSAFPFPLPFGVGVVPLFGLLTELERPNLKFVVLTPADGDAYTAALKRNSDLSVLPAAFIVEPAVPEDIPYALAFAHAQTPPLEIAVKGGGAHSSTWASSAGGVVIDLTKLNRVSVADDKHSVSVQGGALWGDVYDVTSKANVDVVGSPLWFVGVGGFTTGGGYGPLSGELGLAIDNLLSATVVLADGRIVRASKDEEPDLFWAIRGKLSVSVVVAEAHS